MSNDIKQYFISYHLYPSLRDFVNSTFSVMKATRTPFAFKVLLIKVILLCNVKYVQKIQTIKELYNSLISASLVLLCGPGVA